MMTKSLLLLVAMFGFAVATARAEESAQANYAAKCALCHGKTGKGDPKLGQKVGVKDLADEEYQASFTDDKVFTDIKEGLKDGDKIMMKPFGASLSDAEIKALVAYVRSFAKPDGNKIARAK